MNNRKPPFDNLDARLCFAHAFNYEGFNNVILKGLVARNAGPNPNNLWGNPTDLAPYTYDLAKAKQHCDRARAAGAPLDREIEIHIQSELEQTVQAAQMFQADLRKVGVTLKIVPNTWANITGATGRPETTPDIWIHWVSSLLHRPGELDRPDVRQPLPRHLEGQQLVHQPGGRCAADQGPRQPGPGGAHAGCTRKRPASWCARAPTSGSTTRSTCAA